MSFCFVKLNASLEQFSTGIFLIKLCKLKWFFGTVFYWYLFNQIMQVEMVLIGMILFGGMIAAGVKVWLTKRKESEELDDTQA